MRLIDANALKRKSELVAPSVYAVPYRAVSVEEIESAPTIEAEPVRHGRWNFTSCSLCGKSFLDYAEADCDRSIYLDLPNYCPNCGADMRGKNNENE